MKKWWNSWLIYGPIYSREGQPYMEISLNKNHPGFWRFCMVEVMKWVKIRITR